MKMLSAIHLHRNLVLNHTDCILNIRVLSAVLICASKAVGCCCPTMWRHMTPLGANKKLKKKVALVDVFPRVPVSECTQHR